MTEKYFQILFGGLAGELANMTLDQVLDHLDNHLSLFLLDRPVSAAYAERLSRDPGLAASPVAKAMLAHMVSKRLQLHPFDANAALALGRMRGRSDLILRSEMLGATNFEPQGMNDIMAMDEPDERRETVPVLLALLKRYPSYVQATDLLLEFDFIKGREPGDWIGSFQCPARLKSAWQSRLLSHYAGLGLSGPGLEVWQRLAPEERHETNMNLAAELMAAAGDPDGAAALYRSSLEIDPGQAPVRFRLAALEHPWQPDENLLESRDVAVCLYSWNKAHMLAATLKSLAAGRLGRARVVVLLNGCTDQSREAVAALRPHFPEGCLSLVELPVNVGAPAARNWLLALPEVRRADYVAFLDDDVDVPKDWLARYVTVAESDPTIGVVGCRVLSPGRPAQLQYLFRNVAIALPNMMKLSLPAPVHAPDTGLYAFTRDTMNVMGCCHLLRGDVVRELPGFDIRFSPSQVDDLDHDLAVALAGRRIVYCGEVACVHHQNTGIGNVVRNTINKDKAGQIIGNDLKFVFKYSDQLDRLRELALRDRARAKEGRPWR